MPATKVVAEPFGPVPSAANNAKRFLEAVRASQSPANSTTPEQLLATFISLVTGVTHA